MSMKVQYNTAAPYIRNLLVHAVAQSLYANTMVRYREAVGRADGLREALRVMQSSSDQTQVAGIAEEESLPAGALLLAREKYGDVLGEES